MSDLSEVNMAYGIINDIKIAGIACALPNNKLNFCDYYSLFGKENVDKFVKMTGAENTYRALERQTSSDLCYKAAESLLKELDWDKSTVDAIILVTQSPDYRKPATACVLHNRLGLSQDCIAFDINLGCSGYVYGITVIGSLMQSSNINRALLLSGDTSSKSLSEEDKSAYMLFGDAGSATAFEKCCDRKINYMLKTKGEGFKNIILPAGGYRHMEGNRNRYELDDGVSVSDYELHLNGTEIFNFSIKDVPKTINDFLESFEYNINNFDYFFLHQANAFMLKTIGKKCKIPTNKMPIVLCKYGNTSSSSIPLAIADTIINNDVHAELNILISGFGIGLSWGVASLRLDGDMCCLIEHTDDYYDDDLNTEHSC